MCVFGPLLLLHNTEGGVLWVGVMRAGYSTLSHSSNIYVDTCIYQGFIQDLLLGGNIRENAK